jgi:hypothetical protein
MGYLRNQAAKLFHPTTRADSWHVKPMTRSFLLWLFFATAAPAFGGPYNEDLYRKALQN